MRRKAFVLGVFALGLLFGQVPARAEDGESTLNKVTFKGEVRTRFEWNEHMSDPSSNADDSLTYFPYRVRLGIEGKFANNITGFAEFQNFGNFGGAPPTKGGSDSPFHQSFSSGPTDLADGTPGNDTSWLYQGFVTIDKIGGSNFGVRLGRQEHTYGTELLLGDADFYSGVSLDGARGFWAPENWNIDAFYYRTAQRTDFGTATTASDGNLFGASLDYAISQEIGKVGGYVIVNQRPVYTAADNSRITTFGAHFVKLPSTSSAFDWNAEIAAQTGNNSGTALPADVTYGGLVGEGWFGYSFGGNVRSRVHLGALYASGDGDAADDKDKNFQPLFGDLHAWNRLGNLDVFPLSNIFDINAGYSATFSGGKHVLFGGVHVLSLDKVTTPGASKSIGTELDVTYDFRMNKNLGFQVGVANLFPGDAVKDAVAPDSASDPMRVWGQAKLTW